MRYLILVVAALALASCSSMIMGGDRYRDAPRSEGVAESDAATTERIRSRMVDDAMLSNYQIGVTTYKGRVTLTGAVGDFRARNRAEDIAKELAGTRTVNNQIVVNDSSDPR